MRGTRHVVSGAVVVSINGRHWYLGPLVLTVFVGPCPPGKECCHNPDPTPTNNHLSNLRWDTRSGNVADTVRHGRTCRGTSNHFAKITEEAVLEIRRLAALPDWDRNRIARNFGISVGNVGAIVNHRSWKHIEYSATPPIKRTHKLTKDDKAAIMRAIHEKEPRKQIAARYGISADMVYRLVRSHRLALLALESVPVVR